MLPRSPGEKVSQASEMGALVRRALEKTAERKRQENEEKQRTKPVESHL
jgi:hypothetical protein